jgi:hypothetical protein
VLKCWILGVGTGIGEGARGAGVCVYRDCGYEVFRAGEQMGIELSRMKRSS